MGTSAYAFLSARNDAIANVVIIGAGLLTIPTRSIWPDIVVGLCIALMNLDAAREVLEAARESTAGRWTQNPDCLVNRAAALWASLDLITAHCTP